MTVVKNRKQSTDCDRIANEERPQRKGHFHTAYLRFCCCRGSILSLLPLPVSKEVAIRVPPSASLPMSCTKSNACSSHGQKTLIKHTWHPEPGEQQTIERQCLFKLIGMNGSNSGLVLRLYYADEQEIQKTNRAHLIKSLLSGNYLMKTFALKHSDFRQLRNWQKESCLFSKCLKQKNRARQTIEAEEHRMAQWAFALQLKVSQILPPRDT